MVLIKIRLFGIIAALIISSFSFQILALDPDKSIDQYLLDEWDITNGLPGNNIRSIVQTPDGYLWFATSKGLIRFDGIKFHTFSIAGKAGIEDKKSTFPDTLYVDKNGVLWIGSLAGLTRYRYKTGRFKTFTKKEGLTKLRIFRIKEDIKGNLWIGFLVDYLFRYRNGRFTEYNESKGLKGNKITSILEDMKGNLLVGTRENGIFKFQYGKFQKYEIEGIGGNLLITKLYEDRKGCLWIGSNKGLYGIWGKKTNFYTTQDGLSNNNVKDILEDSDRNLWIATLNGLNRMRETKTGKIVFDKCLENCYTRCLFEDREKNVWIGTDDSGIKQLKDGKFISHAVVGKSKREFMVSLFEDQRGDILIGSFPGELIRFRNGEFIESIRVTGISGNIINAIGEDGSGNLWLGTDGKGVFQRKKGTYINYTTKDGLADNMVISIYNDSKNNLWISTYNGVTRYHKGKFESFKTQHGILGDIVNNVYEDKNFNIRLATSRGMNIFKNGKFTKENKTGYLQDIPVTCIYEEKPSSHRVKNVSWIGTHGAGLKRFKDGKFTTYNVDNGMSSNFIYQIFEDKRGNLWMMSDSGILRVNKDELNEYARGNIDRINCTSFGLSDGLKSVEFYNIFSRHSALKTRKGELWFVTKKGISIVNPEKIRVNKFPPPVIIEDVFINNQSLTRESKRDNLKGIKDIVFHFTAPTFISPGKVKFKYKLDGYDREWVFLQPGEKRIAGYSDPAPGTYTFRITACNNDGVWNRTGDSFAFTIKPFFYETILFKISALLFFLLLLITAYFLYKKQLFRITRKYKSSTLYPAVVEECIKKLNYLMEIEKVFQDENISLLSLSEKLSISHHQLSQIINEKLNTKFSDFINTYRIEEAKKLLIDPKRANRKILSIAFDVGFNTKVAFNNAFKKYTKMTPSQYKKKNTTLKL